ncbi:MAG: methyltransferase domain-containing protein [Micrococcaceae bacterium]
MQCHHFTSGACRSCPHIGVSYADQVAAKQRRVRELLDPMCATASSDVDGLWSAPALSPEPHFRNKAKMVVTGTAEHPKLGILDQHQHPKHHDGTGVDLTDCPLYEPRLEAAFAPVADAITTAGLVPYNVGTRTGELKHVIVTISPQQELMIRVVLRSREQLSALRGVVPELQRRLAELQTPAVVVTANLLPMHQALLEGDEEIHLAGDETLRMLLNGVPLNLRPQGFFQTNTVIAAELYAQATAWVDELPAESQPKSVWDLYCGVGGFGFSLAQAQSGPAKGQRRSVWGVEVSTEAIRAAQRTSADLGCDESVRFVAGDATELARDHPEEVPDLVVVNPPRRGIGADLAGWLNDTAGIQHVLYSSCNAKTLAADLEHLPDFAPVRARLLDMFPQTDHYEVLMLLTRS